MVSRRSFIKAGLVGGAALAFGGLLRSGATAGPDSGAFKVLAPADREVLGAIVPVMLAGTEGARAVGSVLETIDQAIAGFPLNLQAEVRQLFGLLAFAPARRWVAGITAPWSEAPPAEVAAFLQRWRTSRFDLLQQAYQALHDLVIGSWYARPDAWPAIGYPGPPRV